MRYVVKKVLPGGAAGLSCQIHPGDIIVDIDNHPTTGAPEHQIAQWVLGEAGALRNTLRTKKSNFRYFSYYLRTRISNSQWVLGEAGARNM